MLCTASSRQQAALLSTAVEPPTVMICKKMHPIRTPSGGTSTNPAP